MEQREHVERKEASQQLELTVGAGNGGIHGVQVLLHLVDPCRVLRRGLRVCVGNMCTTISAQTRTTEPSHFAAENESGTTHHVMSAHSVAVVKNKCRWLSTFVQRKLDVLYRQVLAGTLSAQQCTSTTKWAGGDAT